VIPHIPIEIRFEITPNTRFDLIDIRKQAACCSDTLQGFPQVLYSSFHTTAGFLEQNLISSLSQPTRRGVHSYIDLFRRLFPEGAGYQHDNLSLRQELSDSQRRVEPRNGDAHLAFICSGMCNNVKYLNRAEEPIVLIDLDGAGVEGPRRRVTSILAFNEEQIVAREIHSIPAPSQAIVAVNLKDTRFGIYEYLHEQIVRYGIAKGRVYIRLPADEHHASLMVNEYEPLLMQDLINVLQNLLHFVIEEDHHLFTNCWRNGDKPAGHARYNSSLFLGQDFSVSQARGSLSEMSFAQMNILTAYRVPSIKHSISLLVSDQQVPGCGVIVDGAFQYPIMMQWTNGNSSPRKIEVMLTRFT
jgi:thiamine phosphate synthase YjbQ (UPF0047 family)